MRPRAKSSDSGLKEGLEASRLEFPYFPPGKKIQEICRLFGVYTHPRKPGWWRLQGKEGGKTVHLGYFRDPINALIEFNRLIREAYGPSGLWLWWISSNHKVRLGRSLKFLPSQTDPEPLRTTKLLEPTSHTDNTSLGDIFDELWKENV